MVEAIQTPLEKIANSSILKIEILPQFTLNYWILTQNKSPLVFQKEVLTPKIKLIINRDLFPTWATSPKEQTQMHNNTIIV